MGLQLKRAYDSADEADGERLLVDRLWPRGLRKDQARLSAWLKDLAPSDELRRWFAHDPERWPAFQMRYRAELADPQRAAQLQQVGAMARQGTVTLLFAARDAQRNNAVVLKEAIEDYLEQSAKIR